MTDDDFRELQVRVSELELDGRAKDDRISELERLVKHLGEQQKAHGENLEKHGARLAEVASVQPETASWRAETKQPSEIERQAKAQGRGGAFA